MYGYVYEITNIINGKRYIGSHKYNKYNLDPKYVGSGVMLKKAYDKHGIENFKTIILGFANSKKMIMELETLLIRKHKPEYNIIQGYSGGSFEWHPDFKDIQRRMSESQKGRVFSNETKEKMSIARKKIVCSECGARAGNHYKHCSKFDIKKIELGRQLGLIPKSDKAKQKMSNSWNYEKHFTEECKKKISEKAKGKNNANYGNKWSEEQRETRRGWRNPAHRKLKDPTKCKYKDCEIHKHGSFAINDMR